MIHELLKRVVTQGNPYMTKDMILLQIEFFFTMDKIDLGQYNELQELLNPTEPTT